MKDPSWLVMSIAMSCAVSACSPAQSVRSFHGDWNEVRAREISIEISRSWQFSDANDFHGAPALDLQRNAYSVLPFDHAGESRWLILLAVTPANQNCRACAPVTGGVIFTRKQGEWKAEYDRSHIVSIGANGQPPSARAQTLGAQPAVALEMSSMAQGLQSTTLTLVAEVQGQLKEVLSVETRESNEAAGLPEEQTYKWQANVEPSPSSKDDFPDLVVKSSGTKPQEESQKAKPYSSTSIYRFSDGAYRLVR
jgi:hypothetical protein